MMSERQKQTLGEMAGDRLKLDCPLGPYTTFGIGGPAEALYRARDLDDLRRIIGYLDREGLPFLVLGRGSNLLVRDKGLAGVVIVLGEALSLIEQDPQKEELLLAGGGAPLAGLLAFCREKGLSGLEFLAGIPGSVGGAAFMNAGAFGREIESRIEELLIVTPRGELTTRHRSGLEFHYRRLDLPPSSVIVRVSFEMEKEAPEVIAGRISNYLKQKKRSQPLAYPSAGSVFKNPPGDFAGRLIEQARLKGTRIGEAMISDKHANYIISRGRATAEDVLSLIDLARTRVEEQTGIRLETEIKVVGIE